MYDVIIIGAGPAGIFCAKELGSRYKIAIIDAGKEFSKKCCPYLDNGTCVHCNMCSTLTGFGGAAFYHPGKLSLYPAGSELRNVVGSEERCIDYYKRAGDIFNNHGLDVPFSYGVMEIPEELKNKGIKFYNSYQLMRCELNEFACRIYNELREHIDLFFENKVEKLEKGTYWKVTCENGKVYEGKIICVGTGEYGYRWWERIASELNVDRIASPLDIGVRMVFPPDKLYKIWPYHRDLKIIQRAPNGSEVRTYCTLKNGIIMPCFYDGYTVLDGILDEGSTIAGMTIFNRVMEESLGVDKVSFVRDYLEKFYKKYARPQNCSIQEFLDDNLYDLPKHVYESVTWGLNLVIELLDLEDEIRIYAPVIDSFWKRCIVDQYLETSIKGLYVMGDATGIARGIMQACVTGLMVADGIKGREGHGRSVA